MLKIGITGNIASGKSAVQNILESLGYKVFDADKSAHELLSKSQKVLDTFGTNSREILAGTVFSDKRKLKQLEDILHPLIKDAMLKFFSDNCGQSLIFASVPLLFEAGFDKFVDKIIFISAPYQMRLNRLIQRNGYDENYARLRLESQLSEDVKIPKSDFVIVNDGDLNLLRQKTKECLKLLL